MIELLNKDCFEVMAGMKDHSIDCIITDPPYGSTELDFDRVKLDAEKMISEFQRLIKPNRAVVIFANLRFATRIINANKKFFRYEWVWKKSMKVGFLDCNNRPLKQHEYILIFGNGKPLYRPQMQPGKPYIKIRKMKTTHKLAGLLILASVLGLCNCGPKLPELPVAEVKPYFADAAKTKAIDTAFYEVKDAQGTKIGTVLYSSPYSDGVKGFNGPTPLLIA